MQPFKVTCVTCRAQLSVRDESAIGKILACPKCGSMVQVTAPSAATPAPPSKQGEPSKRPTTAAKTAAAAAMLTSFDDAADLLADEAPLATPPAAAAASPRPNPTPNLTPTRPPAAPASPTAAATTAPAPASAAGGWPWAFFGAVGGSALLGALLVAGAIALLRDDEVQAPQPTSPPPAATTTDEASPPPQEMAEEPPPADADSTVEKAPAVVGDAPAPPTADDVTPTPAPEIENPFAPPPEPAVTEVASASLPETAAPAAEAPAPKQPSRRLRIDPLDVDPEGLDLTTLYNGPPADAEPPAPADDSKASDASAVAAAPADKDAADPAAPAPPAARNAGSEAPPLAAPLVARKYPAISVDKMPLCRFLDAVTQLSGLPVSVSPMQLRLAGVSAAAPVTVKVENATIEAILAAALKPLRLEPVVAAEQIILRRAGEDKRREVVYPVGDLAADPAAVKRLASWIETLAAPQSWKSAGGDGTLKIEGDSLRVNQLESVQYEILVMLEQYRLAGDLQPRSKYPASLLAPIAASGDLNARLAGPTTFTFTTPTPLREIFRYWQEEMGAAVLVDWPALSRERLWPQSLARMSANNTSWSDALDAALRPLGLGWRAVGSRTIEITSRDVAEQEPTIEVIRLAANADVTAKELNAKVAALGSSDDAAGKAPAAYDAERRVLLVRQPAAGQRKLVAQLAKEKLLPVASDGAK